MLNLLLIVNIITTYSLIVYFLLVFDLFNAFTKPTLLISLLLIAIYISVDFLKKIKSFDYSKLKLTKSNISTYLLLLLVTALFTFLYANPFEEFLGGRDPGVYISLAENIAKKESIKERLPILEKSTIDGETSDFFHYEPSRPDWVGHKGYYFLGYYITNPEKGELTPQFLHLPSTVTAGWINIFGTKNVIYFMPTLVVFISIMLFAFIKKYITENSNIALAGLLLWLTSPAILFWSRSFNSESFVLLFVLTLMLNAFFYLKSRNIFFALFAVISLLAAFLSRGDSLVFIIVILVLISLIKTLKRGLIITLTLSLLFYLAFSSVLIDTYPYFSYHSTLIVKIPGFSQKIIYELRNILPLLVGVVFFISGSVFIIIRRVTLITKPLRVFSRLYRKYYIYSAVVLVFSFLALYQLLSILKVFPFLYDISLASNKANLIKSSWYIGGIIGWISIITGLVFLIKISLDKIRSEKKYLLLLTFILLEIVFSLFFIYKSQISLDQPWWSRRYLVPTILLIPISFVSVWQALNFKRILNITLIVSLFFAILVSNFYYARPIIGTQKYTGSYKFLQDLNSCFDKSSSTVILFDTSYNPSNPKTRAAYLAGNFFGQPLWVYYDRTVFYPQDKISPDTLSKKIISLSAEGKKVYVINPSKELLARSYNFEKVCETNFNSEMLGWGSVLDKKNALNDLKLSPASSVKINLPLKVFAVKR